MRKMPQTRRMAAQTVCHFSHNADFCRLRISKYPANAHKTNYFSARPHPKDFPIFLQYLNPFPHLLRYN